MRFVSCCCWRSPPTAHGQSLSGFRCDLQELGLSQCGLGRLPSRIGNLQQLRQLNAGSNNLISVPRSIGECQKLEVHPAACQMHFNGTRLRSMLDCEALRMGCGQVLALDRNILVEIPNEIGGLANLRWIL